MGSKDCQGCQEYVQLSRRRFLGLGTGLLAAAAVPAWLPRVVYADSDDSSRDVLVSLFLRGGADALTLCVPFGEPAYYRWRPNLAIAPPDSGSAAAALDLDGFFGFPPAMAPLLDAWGAGDLALVHACGLPQTPRSHFDAMRFMEVGQLGSSVITGWLGRHLAQTAPTTADSLLRSVAIGEALPRTLVGAPQTLPVPDPESFGLAGRPETEAARRGAILGMYDPATLLGDVARNTMKTIDLLQQIDVASYLPAAGVTYPETEFGTALRSAAALIQADAGVEAIAIDVGEWDTHDLQGPADGEMAQQMTQLAEGLAAFYADVIQGRGAAVTTVAMSEFGRNAFENGSGGTDHGHGGAMLVMGPTVTGGRVITEWPGLEAEQLFDQQDLAITIDYRDVLAEVLTKRAGNRDIGAVFDDPGYTPVDRGVIAAAGAALAG